MEVAVEEVNTYLTHPDRVGYVDVVAMFGGESGVGRLCIRRRLKRGGNFALVSGFDLTKSSDRKHVVDDSNAQKPLMAILGPPCTSFGA